jgi:hypothetical protein
MVVLSSSKSVELHNLVVGNEAMLVIAQMPVELLWRFAAKLGVTFTPSEYGVYKKVFRPSTRRCIHIYSKPPLVPIWDDHNYWNSNVIPLVVVHHYQ